MKGLILMNNLIFLIVILPLSDIYMKDNENVGYHCKEWLNISFFLYLCIPKVNPFTI